MTALSSPRQQTLRQLRQARGWSQQDVAEQVGVKPKQVQAWERGDYLPRPVTWQRLADLFGVGMDEIVFGEGGQP